MRVRLVKQFMSEEIVEAVIQALQNERAVMGESVFKFEEELARYFGVKYAVTTSSGTHALQFALIAVGVRAGKKVVTTPYSFIATANSVIHAGGVPVFADVREDTFNLDPSKVPEVLDEDVSAILPVHLFGYPADMDEICSIAEDRKLAVIEDACQAHGAVYKGRKVGGIGDAGCLSFYPTKNMSVLGDGGAILTNDEEIAEVVRKLRDCGRRSRYVHDMIGYTARLNTINAAIGRVQLRHLDEWNERRREIAEKYRRLLSDIDEIKLPPRGDHGIEPVYHLYTIRTERRDELREWLERCGIECGVYYPLPIHLQPIYRKLFNFREGSYPVSEKLSKTCLSIPIHPFLKDDEVRYICEKIHEFYGEDH